MSEKPTTIKIDDVEYIRKDSVPHHKMASECAGMSYVIVRTKYAGVFAGFLASKTDKVVVLKHTRRLWYWEGAASLSQAAMEGFSKPSKCKFPCPVESVILNEWIEILPCTEIARLNIKGVPEWRA